MSSSERWLVAGLGNPGPEYSHNRHNVGYWCVNRLARLHGIKLKAGRLATLGKGTIRNCEAILIKPRTFMNRSGQPISVAMQQARVTPPRLIVVYDDLDLPTGRLRIRASGSHGGNNGLRSVINGVGSQDFPRIRVGISRPYDDGEPVRDPERVAEWVLGDPAPDEAQVLHEAATRATEAVEMILAEGVEAAMNRFNQ